MDAGRVEDEPLERSWTATCRIVLGGEVGGLEKYGPWLSEHMVPLLRKKSALSGRDVCCGVPDYAPGARFISLEEADFGKTFEPLGINQIKDLDSIAEALQERGRLAYCGNVVLGNSRNVEDSSNVHDSFNVLGSNFIYDSEYVAYSSYCRGSRRLFGVVSDLNCDSLIRVYETHRQSRCLEAWSCYNSSDCYFSSCVEGSRDAMFSFNLRNRRNVIGNLELPKDKYLQLKAKLLEEMRAELEADKKLPSLADIAASGPPPAPLGFPEAEDADEGEIAPMEVAFQKTTGLLLGKPLHDFRSYEKWLMRHVPGIEKAKSAVSGRPVCISLAKPTDLFPRDRLVTLDECWKVGSLVRLRPQDIESFGKLKRSVGSIAYFGPEWKFGECSNLMLVPFSNTSRNCYHCGIASFAENAAYSYWPRESRYVFGSSLAFTSNFCMNAYHSTNLSRAFETDGCNRCSDVYFTHNCENVRDSMFCFNAKNLNSAIGNASLPPGQYRMVKAALLEQMAGELEGKKELKWDILGLGSGC